MQMEDFVNKGSYDLMNILNKGTYENQRQLASVSGYSLGKVNISVRELIDAGYIDKKLCLTDEGKRFMENNRPKRAVILAAGLGMRMIPINSETPKALVQVRGEVLIERVIRQLHEAGIYEIYVVVGFMKEMFEYLIDDYGVNLIVNCQYADRNNLHSLMLAEKHLDQAYVVPGDILCEDNPFSEYELYPWYMVSDQPGNNSNVRVNRKDELVFSAENGNRMIGIAYLDKEAAEYVRRNLKKFDKMRKYNDEFWEETLFYEDKMVVYAKVVSHQKAVEIDTYEQLREIDSRSSQLNSDAIITAAEALHARPEDIRNVAVLKKGMTNRSFMFECLGSRYIMRIPGEGTGQLISRSQEADVYNVIKDKGLSDDIIYINPDNGYKITKFIENARNCDPMNERDVKICMRRLREFHEMRLSVNHTFDIFGLIDFYESLWNGSPSVFRDYQKTKENVFELKEYIDSCEKDWCLTHIDAVPDNFIFTGSEVKLIDWEYAGMQDPHVDIAMFCIYSMYDREHTEKLIDAYFSEGCSKENRIKIYCYIAACGLLWSNWCEYKRTFGVEFGEYALAQFRYAKDYCRLAKKEMNGL